MPPREPPRLAFPAPSPPCCLFVLPPRPGPGTKPLCAPGRRRRSFRPVCVSPLLPPAPPPPVSVWGLRRPRAVSGRRPGAPCRGEPGPGPGRRLRGTRWLRVGSPDGSVMRTRDRSRRWGDGPARPAGRCRGRGEAGKAGSPAAGATPGAAGARGLPGKTGLAPGCPAGGGGRAGPGPWTPARRPTREGGFFVCGGEKGPAASRGRESVPKRAAGWPGAGRAEGGSAAGGSAWSGRCCSGTACADPRNRWIVSEPAFKPLPSGFSSKAFPSGGGSRFGTRSFRFPHVLWGGGEGGGCWGFFNSPCNLSVCAA